MIIREAPRDPEPVDATVDVPVDGRTYRPCSQAQQRFWFEEQLHPGNPGLNVAVRWRLEGDLSDTELEDSWRRLIARHQPLRTTLGLVNGELTQIVEPSCSFAIRIVDLSLLAEADARAEAERLAEREARTPFDLSVAPLIRVTRLVLNKTLSILLVTAHHAVCDGWSVGILAAEMGELCAAVRAGRPPALPALPLDYGDYAAWERAWLAESALTEETAYSQRLLDGYKHFELLPDRPRPAIQSSNGEIVSTVLDRELTAQLDALGRSNGCTLFMTALAALLLLLHRHSGETDIMLGTQVAGRDEPELEGLVGCFINTIALRTDLSGDPTFLELLERVRDNVTESFEIRHFPLERLIEVINPKRDLSRNALFSVNFVVQRSFIKNEDYGSFALFDMPSVSAGALYDLNVFMVERTDGWRASCEFNTDLFDRSTIEGLLGRFEIALRSIVDDPSQRISGLPILGDAERRHLIVERNRTEAPYPADLTLPQLFAAQARRTPGAMAVVCGDKRRTYAELSAAVTRMANALRHAGHAPGKRIGVFLDRSVDLVVALLGVLEAGSAYVPLDPNYPEKRIATIARDAGLTALITRSSLRGRVPDIDVPVIAVDTALPGTDPASADAAPPAPADPAYVIYTSGSTGAPKGVQIPHRALVNFLCSMRTRPGLTDRDTLVSVTTVSFDIAGLELYLPLMTGATLVVAQDDDVVDGSRLLALLRTSRATVMQATPTTWQLLIEAGWRGDPALKMLCGGEAIPRALADQLLERGDELWNMYGPTETTIWSSALRVERGTGPVPLGPPIGNTQFYVVDAYGGLAPPGAPGELAIGGDGVATGYFGLPELTAERFVPDIFGAVPGARLYKTGDRVRLRARGQFEFLGRNDQQIKLRGFRIELGEIEAALAHHPGVAEAAVVAREDGAGETMIVAFAVPREPGARSAHAWSDDLRRDLSGTLPRYMIPALIVVLDALPHTPNGKLDRGALTVPKRAGMAPVLDRTIATPAQLRITEIIAKLLGREWLGLDDDIFAIGFHSLLAVRFVDDVRRTFGVALPLRALFTYPTVRGLAQQVEALGAGLRAPATTAITTLNAGGTRTPFIFLHSDLYAEGIYSRRLAALLDPGQTMLSVAPHGTAGLPLLPTIEAMALDYLDRIRAVQPRGPYRLGGFCASGLVAYELARLLQARGEVIEDVLLVNASALPQRAVPGLDALVRAIGLDVGLAPDLREALIYNVARLHAALARGPRATVSFIADRLGLPGTRLPKKGTPRRSELEAFQKRGGSAETENSFVHLVASLTYHPEPYDGRVTLIWGMERKLRSSDPTVGWGALARDVRVVPMDVGHVTVLHEDVEQLGSVLEGLLRQ